MKDTEPEAGACGIAVAKTGEAEVMAHSAERFILQTLPQSTQCLQNCQLRREDIPVEKVFDEHAILNDKAFHDSVEVGDKVRIIPVHIRPVCSLYEVAYLIDGDDVICALPLACREKLQ